MLQKKHVVGSVVLIGLLALGFLMVTNTFVSSEGVPYTPKVKQADSTAVKSDAQFHIAVVNKVVVEANGLTRAAAEARCDEIAFDTKNMWKQVICVFEGEEIYNDIFIAG